YSTTVSTSNGPMTSSSSARYVPLGCSICVFANTSPLTRAASPAVFTSEDTLYSTPLILMVTLPPSAQSDCTTVIGLSCVCVALAGNARDTSVSIVPVSTTSASPMCLFICDTSIIGTNANPQYQTRSVYIMDTGLCWANGSNV